MQPAYLAWPGYFDRILNSDLLIYLDDVKLDHSSKTRFTNRNKINTSNGPIWLTLPLKLKGNRDKNINELLLVEDQWRKKHKKNIYFNYKNAPFFNELSPSILSSYEYNWDSMVEFIYHLDNLFFEFLNIKTKIIYSSEMNVNGVKGDYILNLCKAVGANEYISGPFGVDYLDKSVFKRENIKVLIHEHHPISYTQNFINFTPYLSIIDLIFNLGYKTINLIKEGTKLKEL